MEKGAWKIGGSFGLPEEYSCRQASASQLWSGRVFSDHVEKIMHEQSLPDDQRECFCFRRISVDVVINVFAHLQAFFQGIKKIKCTDIEISPVK